ncbi:putative outer membrane lipoWza domain protein [Escherichia coli]|nr:putative outer membrane lipoWza domain protein [Escherichia coli]
MVNIYPVTPGLIDQLRAKPIMSQANPELSSKSQTMNIVSALGMC